jgi:hypothetical protein
VSDDVLELAERHLDLLYERDGAGFLLRSRDPDVVAPLVHLVRTSAGNRWCFSAAFNRAERRQLHEAVSAEAVVYDSSEWEGRPPSLAGVLPLLRSRGIDEHQHRGPAFRFGEQIEAPRRAEVVGFVQLARAVPELTWVSDVAGTAYPVAVVRNDEGLAVSVCHCSRSTPWGAEAGVETAPDRGRGLAVDAVLAWAAAVRSEGRVPLYSTSWRNTASRALAWKLGLQLYGEDCAIGLPGPGA